ncbi:CAP domain-containing protein [Streptomyces sp. JJ36]|uniref:CAP domain-containing protein n=1 Tax=Streptomyces sp. JJ36 TaxID=2736645 RepID=UPI001F35CF2F|nr:CAP domain-containing protein [Streptomyces sp. JJ36]MCF6526036.1 CAP domain-containing protein [Streptomyces sp. JJ36]
MRSAWRKSLVTAAAVAALCALTPGGGSAAVPYAVAPRADVVALVNAYRAEAGCPAVHPHPALRHAASVHSDHMARTQRLTHQGARGSGPGQRADAAGYDASRVAENVAHAGPAAEVVATWMSSPGHRRNMLDCRYRNIGVGMTPDAGGLWWTQLLATGAR